MKLEDPTGMVQMFTSHMVKMFEDAGGTNYVEWTVTHQETRKTYSLMMQRRDGKTPAEINHELKERVKELEDGIRWHKDAWRISKAYGDHDKALYKLLEK